MAVATTKKRTKSKMLTHEEETELLTRWKDSRDPKACRRLELAFQPLLLTITKDVYKRFKWMPNVDIEDIHSEVNLGFIITLDRFDLSHGVRLATYMKTSIAYEVADRIRKQHQVVHVPTSRTMRSVMKQIAGPDADRSSDTVAKETGIDPATVSNLIGAFNRPTSLDHMMASDDRDFGDEYLGEVWRLNNDAIEDTLGEAETLQLQKALLEEYFETLQPRQQFIMRHRYGLNGAKAQTLGEISEEIGVSRERVRQIQESALETLKNEIYWHARKSPAEVEAIFSPDILKEKEANPPPRPSSFFKFAATEDDVSEDSAAVAADVGAKNQTDVPRQVDMFDYILTLEPAPQKPKRSKVASRQSKPPIVAAAQNPSFREYVADF